MMAYSATTAQGGAQRIYLQRKGEAVAPPLFGAIWSLANGQPAISEVLVSAPHDFARQA